MEPHWNPSVELQALARIYRMGQQRPVTTIRYIMRDFYEKVCSTSRLRVRTLTFGSMCLASKIESNTWPTFCFHRMNAAPPKAIMSGSM